MDAMRNPNAEMRPDFASICQFLEKPEYWIRDQSSTEGDLADFEEYRRQIDEFERQREQDERDPDRGIARATKLLGICRCTGKIKLYWLTLPELIAAVFA
jgi:hypothetical protein